MCPYVLLIRLNYLSKNIFMILTVMESSAQVHYALGGVARNVADCMSKLGTKPFMISAVGLDMAG
jgi:sugar/nucleoside kinase (ribokinase family)